MKIIAITSPQATDDDASLIKRLLECGVHAVHLRKPEADVHYCRALLRSLTAVERAKIVIHDYVELYDEFSLMGIHINKNVSVLPEDYRGVRTRSCHSIAEIKRFKDDYDYLFLSPIFDSVSKVGYKSGISRDELMLASTQGIIDEKVIALGGVTFDSIPYLDELNFGGVAMIGALYSTDGLESLKTFDIL